MQGGRLKAQSKHHSVHSFTNSVATTVLLLHVSLMCVGRLHQGKVRSYLKLGHEVIDALINEMSFITIGKALNTKEKERFWTFQPVIGYQWFEGVAQMCHISYNSALKT